MQGPAHDLTSLPQDSEHIDDPMAQANYLQSLPQDSVLQNEPMTLESDFQRLPQDSEHQDEPMTQDNGSQFASGELVKPLKGPHNERMNS